MSSERNDAPAQLVQVLDSAKRECGRRLDGSVAELREVLPAKSAPHKVFTAKLLAGLERGRHEGRSS